MRFGNDRVKLAGNIPLTLCDNLNIGIRVSDVSTVTFLLEDDMKHLA